ncbi:MAG: hypothetical protein IV100_18555 [Myxococcales bacterium]|nr:hypothetical protein [Myxococcales bacterium]
MRVIHLAHLFVMVLPLACAESELESPGPLSLVKSAALAGGAAGLITHAGVDVTMTYAGASQVYLTNASSSWPSQPDLESPAVVAVVDTDDGLVTVDAAGTWRWRDSQGVAQSLAGPTPLQLIRSGDVLYAPLGPGGVATAPTDLAAPPTLLPGLEGTLDLAVMPQGRWLLARADAGVSVTENRKVVTTMGLGGPVLRVRYPYGLPPLALTTSSLVVLDVDGRNVEASVTIPLSGSCRSLETEPNIHWVYVACTDRLHVLDLANPTRPVRIGTLVLGGERVLGVVEYTDEELLVRGRDDVSWVELVP